MVRTHTPGPRVQTLRGIRCTCTPPPPPNRPHAASREVQWKIHTGEWISEGGHDQSRCSLTLAWKWMPCWYASSLCSGTLESARSSTRLYLFLAGIARAQEGEPHYGQKAKRLDVLRAPLSLNPARFKAKRRRSRHARVRKHRAVLSESKPRCIVVAPGKGPPRGHSLSSSPSSPTLPCSRA